MAGRRLKTYDVEYLTKDGKTGIRVQKSFTLEEAINTVEWFSGVAKVTRARLAYDMNLRIVDVAADFRKTFGDLDFNNQPLPEHDYRLEIDTPSGGLVTFHQGATADHVKEYMRREGWIL